MSNNDDLLASLPEWGNYVAEPGPATYGALIGAADTANVRDSVPCALATLFAASSNWRTAQHLAVEFTKRLCDTTLGEYYAAKAVELSNGELVAHLLLARCFWLQRFPEAVLTQLKIVEERIETYSPMERRGAFMLEVADLYVNTYAYANRLDLARPWIDRLLTPGHPINLETVIQLLVSSLHTDEIELAVRAASFITDSKAPTNPRVAAFVEMAMRAQFLRTLQARQAQL